MRRWRQAEQPSPSSSDAVPCQEAAQWDANSQAGGAAPQAAWKRARSRRVFASARVHALSTAPSPERSSVSA